MLKRNQCLMALVAGVVGVAVSGAGDWPDAWAQTRNRQLFQGRGVAQGSAFARGRNANLSLTLDGENFGLEMTEPQASGNRTRIPGRVQYRGVVVRRNDEGSGSNSFTLMTRVRSFDSSDDLRLITNTTGTCRIEVYDARVIYSNCNAIADDSSTRFLGLQQF